MSYPNSVWEIVSRNAADTPHRTAIWVSGRALTNDELFRAAEAVGAEFHRRGVRAGDLVALWARSSIESFAAFFAAARIGAVVAPLNIRLTPVELLPIFDRLRPRAVVFDEIEVRGLAHEPVLAEWVAGGGERLAWATGLSAGGHPTIAGVLDRATNQPSAPDTVPGDGDTEFLIQLTSGSTAAPKAVLLTQGQCARMGWGLADRYDIRPGDRYFVCNPIHHVGCTNFGLMAALSKSATFYTLTDFDGESAVAVVQEQRCTHHHGIEAHYVYEYGAERLRPNSTDLRVLVAHGDNARRARERFGEVTTVSCYGQSETSGGPVCSSVDDPEEVRLTTAGRPLPGVELAIADPSTGEHLPVGDAGEILVRGWCVMRGYVGEPELTAKAIDSDGWYHTGDVGRLDVAGYLSFVSRMKDFLRVGGENVAASEIEAVLQAHRAVRVALVVGLPHDLLGEVPVAFVVPEDAADLTVNALVEYAGGRLASFKVPRQIHLVDIETLPMSGPGKFNKPRLRELAERLRGEATTV